MLRTLKNTYHLGRALIANTRYGFPSRQMTVIGVTGTDGKTTTSSLIYHILNEAGLKVAMITTIGAYLGDKAIDTGFHVTTPSSMALNKYISRAKKAGMQYLVLETTSHALDQNRVAGISFDIAVLTNITHEHLDYHKTYNKYLAAKLKLLKKAKVAVLNMDDKSFGLVKRSLQKKIVYTYSLTNQKASFTPRKYPFNTRLLGHFNRANSLAAIAVAKRLKIADQDIRRALLSFSAPIGRQEMLYNKNFSVMVDFAHTPQAFLQILSDLKRKTKARLIHVFGSAGERDSSKRPFMGKASSKYSDIIILTAEDPRHESVSKINKDIRSGVTKEFKELVNSQELLAISQQKNIIESNGHQPASTAKRGELIAKGKLLFEIPDREEAIKFALSMAERGDFIVITGKGHEQSMNLGQGEVPWSDVKVVKKYLPQD